MNTVSTIIRKAQQAFAMEDSPERTVALDKFVSLLKPIVLAEASVADLGWDDVNDVVTECFINCLSVLQKWVDGEHPLALFRVVIRRTVWREVAAIRKSQSAVVVFSENSSVESLPGKPEVLDGVRRELLYRHLVDGEGTRKLAAEIGVSEGKLLRMLEQEVDSVLDAYESFVN